MAHEYERCTHLFTCVAPCLPRLLLCFTLTTFTFTFAHSMEKEVYGTSQLASLTKALRSTLPSSG